MYSTAIVWMILLLATFFCNLLNVKVYTNNIVAASGVRFLAWRAEDKRFLVGREQFLFSTVCVASQRLEDTSPKTPKVLSPSSRPLANRCKSAIGLCMVVRVRMFRSGGGRGSTSPTLLLVLRGPRRFRF